MLRTIISRRCDDARDVRMYSECGRVDTVGRMPDTGEASFRCVGRQICMRNLEFARCNNRRAVPWYPAHTRFHYPDWTQAASGSTPASASWIRSSLSRLISSFRDASAFRRRIIHTYDTCNRYRERARDISVCLTSIASSNSRLKATNSLFVSRRGYIYFDSIPKRERSDRIEANDSRFKESIAIGDNR